MSAPRFFGYGSLVNRATHGYDDPRPAELEGWRRVWRHTTLREVAFLSVDPAPGTRILGLTAAVPGADWAALDARERAYARHDVTHAVTHDGRPAPVATYRVSEGNIGEASVAAPILRSYLDTVLGGFWSEFGSDGVAHFFDTTDGWGPVRDDRAAPVYPRHVAAPRELSRLVDARLAALNRAA